MKLDIKKVLGVACAVLCGGAWAAPSLTYINWQAVDGEWSGSYADAAHWAEGVVPGALNLAKVDLTSAGAKVVTNSFPEGTYETKASQRWNVPNTAGSAFVWDGSKTTFLMPSCDTANYGDEPFRIQWLGNHFFNYQCYNDAATIRNKHAIAKIENGVWRIASPNTLDDPIKLDFEKGVFNFCDPEGTAYNSSYFRVGHNS